MGNVIGQMITVDDKWPADHVNKAHWCYETGDDYKQHYCVDAEPEDHHHDKEFDYSVFKCAKARCQTCVDVNQDIYPSRDLRPKINGQKADPESRKIHFSYRSLEESSSSKCRVCSVLLEGLAVVSGRKSFEPGDILCLELLNGFTVRLTHQTSVTSSAKEEEKLIVEYHSAVDDTRPDEWKAFGPAGGVISDLGVRRCVNFVDSCIKKCDGHPECVLSQSRNRKVNVLPTRLIDVGTGEHDVRLQLSPQAGEYYIALSHAWGTSHLLTTTIANLQQHSENIPWTSLSRTFQEAVSITQGLGIRYIWIDTLCIIQDSPNDWEREAKEMKNVYAYAYLTIAATSAAESTQGIFRPRYNLNEDNVRDFSREFEIRRESDVSQPTIYARRSIKYSHKFLLSLEYKGGHKELAPLLYRAWVLQERILSPRILHFSFDEMVFECKTGFDCECGFASSPSGRALSISALGLEIFKELFNNTKESGSLAEDDMQDTEHEEKLFLAWYRLVEYYMALTLTYPSDRLPALRGMTKSLGERVGWTDLAGIWLEDPARGLLWSGNWLRTFKRNKSAPTWSWASMEPNDGPDWDRSALTVSAVYDVLRFDMAGTDGFFKDTLVHDSFRLVSHSADPRQPQDKEADNLFQGAVPGNCVYLVVEAPSMSAIVVTEVTDAANSEPDSTASSSEDQVEQDIVHVSDNTIAGDEVVSDDDEAEIKQDSMALRLAIEGFDELIGVSWDISDNNNTNEYEEVAEGDDLVALLMTQPNPASKETAHLTGLVLKKTLIGGIEVYQRLGCFSYAQDKGDFFNKAIVKPVVLV